MSTVTKISQVRISIVAVVMAVLVACSVSVGAAPRAYADSISAVDASDTLSAQDLSAASTWSLSKRSVTLKAYSKGVKVSLKNYTGSTPTVTSSKPGVVTAYPYHDSTTGEYYVQLYKRGVGSAKVTVTDSYGTVTRTIKVKAKKAKFGMQTKNYTFSKKNFSSYLYAYSSGEPLKAAKSSKPSVASVKVEKGEAGDGGKYGYAIVTPKKTGTTKITYTDIYGHKLKYTIKVKSNYWKANLKNSTYASMGYAYKTVNAYSRPYAKVTLKIGSEKHTAKADKDGKLTFPINDVYPVGTEYTLKAKTKKASATATGKVYSSGYCSWNGSIWSCKKYVPVRVSNAHAGDYLVLQIGTERHTQTIYSDWSTYTTNMYMNYNLSNYTYRTMTLTLYNKFDQKLSSASDWYITFS